VWQITLVSADTRILNIDTVKTLHLTLLVFWRLCSIYPYYVRAWIGVHITCVRSCMEITLRYLKICNGLQKFGQNHAFTSAIRETDSKLQRFGRSGRLFDFWHWHEIFLFLNTSNQARGWDKLLFSVYRGLFPAGKTIGAWNLPLSSL
jgi:hypothetical protein